MAIFKSHGNFSFLGTLSFLLLLPHARALGAVDHVATRNLVLAGAHQGQFNLILNIFYMNSAAGRHASSEDVGDLRAQLCYRFVNSGRGGGVATLNCQVSLGDGY